MSNIHYGDVATWFASIGTVGTLLFTAASLAIDRRQSRINVHKDQAARISSWVAKEERGKAWLAVLNQSKDPVYEVMLSIVSFNEAKNATGKHTPQAYRDYLSIVPPGKYFGCVEDGYNGIAFHPSVEIAFKDVGGQYWLRKGDGTLEELEQSPTEYYRVTLPVDWQLPEQQLPDISHHG